MNNTKDIKQILSRINVVIERWQEADTVSRLERDLILARLRDLYELIAVCGDSAPQAEAYSGTSIDIETIALESEAPLLEFEPVATKKMDRSAIMSLYCDRTTVDLSTDEQEKVSVEIEEVDAPTPGANDGEREKESEVAAVETHGTKVLGDVLGSGDKRVADMLSGGGDKTDVASKIIAQQTADLRTSIGVNDRFLLIRDLFDSNAIAYDSTINRLEAFDDLNQALIYIYENHSWDPNSDAVKLLIDLLTRKLT